MSRKYGRVNHPDGSYEIRRSGTTTLYDKDGNLKVVVSGLVEPDGDAVGDFIWALGVVLGVIALAIIILS